MKDTTKKIAYLKGLVDSIQPDSAEKSLMTSVLDVLDQISDDIDSLDDKLVDLNDYVESIDDDLTALEDDADAFSDSLDSDDDMDFDDDDDAFEEKLHVVQHHPSSNLLLNGRLCSNCNRLFMISFNDAPDAEYVCPFCGTQMKPNSIDPENLPTVSPAK